MVRDKPIPVIGPYECVGLSLCKGRKGQMVWLKQTGSCKEGGEYANCHSKQIRGQSHLVSGSLGLSLRTPLTSASLFGRSDGNRNRSLVFSCTFFSLALLCLQHLTRLIAVYS